MRFAGRQIASNERASTTRSLGESAILPWAFVAFGLIGSFAGPLGEALRGLRLPDTDDAMRLAQVRDLVAGQSWFDMIQHRFLPPMGVASHWSRFVDAPLAAGIAGLTPLLGASLAERLTTASWPLLLFAAYAAVLLSGMGPLFGRRAAVLALFAATQTIGLVMQFAPGRIDHHNVQIVLMLGVGLCLMKPRPDRYAGALAGGLSALSLAIGLEALPLVALAGLIVGIDWIRVGRPAVPGLLGFGLTLGCVAPLLYGLQTAPASWSGTACDALSPPWLWLAGTGGALALIAALAHPVRPVTRLALVMIVGSGALAGFVLLFPMCAHGPFPEMPERVRLHWLDQVREMRPIWTMLRERLAEGLAFAAVLVVATFAAAIMAWRDAQHRRALTIASLFLGTGTVLTLFQMRGIYVASGYVAPIAGICLDRALAPSGPDGVGARTRAAWLAAAIALNAQAWLAVGRAIEYVGGLGIEDAARVSQFETCSAVSGLAALDALPPGTVLAPIDFGPYLLVHTHHAVVAAPYHRASAGLLAGLALLDGDETELQRQANFTGATYLTLCPDTARKGDANSDAFALRLARGQAAATWLEPLAVPGAGLKVWRILDP